MVPIKKYGIKLRLVEETDAAFILNIRMDAKRSRYISKTDSDNEKQRLWIRNYKIREADGREYYFIAEDENGTPFATYRVYDISDHSAVIGSWVTKPGYTNSANSIKVDIAVKEFVFEVLGFNHVFFDVHKENKSVLRYHRLFNPKIVRETEIDFTFELVRDIFFERRSTLFKNI